MHIRINKYSYIYIDAMAGAHLRLKDGDRVKIMSLRNKLIVAKSFDGDYELRSVDKANALQATITPDIASDIKSMF